MVATLTAGLRDDSRLKLKMRGEKYPRQLVASAIIADRLTAIQYQLFHIDKKPVFLTELLFPDEEETTKTKPQVFATPEDFHNAYQKLTKQGGD